MFIFFGTRLLCRKDREVMLAGTGYFERAQRHASFILEASLASKVFIARIQDSSSSIIPFIHQCFSPPLNTC